MYLSDFLKLALKDLYVFFRFDFLTLSLQCIMTSLGLIKSTVIWGRVGEFLLYKPHPHSLTYDYPYEIKIRKKIQVVYKKYCTSSKKFTTLIPGFNLMYISLV